MNMGEPKLNCSFKTEVWNFFFIGCLPYIEGIFLPLRTDALVRAIVGNTGTSNGRSMSFTSSTGRDAVEVIDIRRIALRAFRDHLVLPIVDRVRKSRMSSPWSPAYEAPWCNSWLFSSRLIPVHLLRILQNHLLDRDQC